MYTKIVSLDFEQFDYPILFFILLFLVSKFFFISQLLKSDFPMIPLNEFFIFDTGIFYFIWILYYIIYSIRLFH